MLDTNVLAYALFDADARAEACLRALSVAERVLAPDLLRAELLSVLRQAVRADHIDPDTALGMLDDGQAVVTRFFDTAMLWQDALALALARDHSSYDVLFVALAMQQSAALVTHHGRLLERFPETAITPADFVERALR